MLRIPKRKRLQLGAALERMGDDPGWDEEIRGLCMLLVGCAADYDEGVPMVKQLSALDGIDITDGSLAWVVRCDSNE